jgi:hypothetical protein
MCPAWSNNSRAKNGQGTSHGPQRFLAKRIRIFLSSRTRPIAGRAETGAGGAIPSGHPEQQASDLRPRPPVLAQLTRGLDATHLHARGLRLLKPVRVFFTGG